MSIFANATPAEKPKNKTEFILTQVAAGLLTVVGVMQLLTFEDYPTVLMGQPLVENVSAGLLVATFIVVTEVFAVPFLLRMRLSPLMRLASYMAGWGIAITWFIISMQLFAVSGQAIDTGLLGATLPIMQPVLPFALSLIIMASLVVSRPASIFPSVSRP